MAPNLVRLTPALCLCYRKRTTVCLRCAENKIKDINMKITIYTLKITITIPHIGRTAFLTIGTELICLCCHSLGLPSTTECILSTTVKLWKHLCIMKMYTKTCQAGNDNICSGDGSLRTLHAMPQATHMVPPHTTLMSMGNSSNSTTLHFKKLQLTL